MPQISCPNGHALQVTDQHIGQRVTCPRCQASFVAQETGFAPSTSSPAAMEAAEESRPPVGGKKVFAGFSLTELINCFVGRPLLFFGLIFVVLGRGCDATSMRSVSRSTAQYNQAQASFRLEWDGKLAKLQQDITKKNREINTLFDGGKFGDPELNKRRDDLQKQLADLNKERNKIQDDQQSARADKDAGEWKPLREAAIKASSNHQMSIYWYEWIFILGTVVLVLGMLTLAFTGQGPEKWIAYIMIAILTFSIYVGGFAWVSSISSSLDRSRIDPIEFREFK